MDDLLEQSKEEIILQMKKMVVQGYSIFAMNIIVMVLCAINSVVFYKRNNLVGACVMAFVVFFNVFPTIKVYNSTKHLHKNFM